VNQDETNVPKFIQLTAYKDALWTGFAFGVSGTLLAAAFLRGAGIVGHHLHQGEEEKSVLTEATHVDGQDEKV